MANWVIDVNILRKAADTQDSSCGTAIYLLETLRRFHKIAFDHERRIQDQFEAITGTNKLLKIWYGNLFRHSGKIIFVSSRIDASIQKNLDALKFDPDDTAYVGTALNADKLICSEDSDFHCPAITNYFNTVLALQVYAMEAALSEEAKRRA